MCFMDRILGEINIIYIVLLLCSTELEARVTGSLCDNVMINIGGIYSKALLENTLTAC